MREVALHSASSFPMAQCRECGKIVLTAIAFDDRGEQRICVHCDSPAGSAIEWVDAAELEQRGYFFGAPAAKAKGCGGGCGTSCGTRSH